MGAYAGLLSSIGFSLTIEIQNVMNYSCDEKARWEKYQLAFPLDNHRVVASKYISIILTVGVSISGSIIFSLISSLVNSSFGPLLWGISTVAVILIPLFWTGICLPLAYWFGSRSTQIMGILMIIPLVRLISYFENGHGISAVVNSGYVYLLWAFIVTVAVFAVSYIANVGGYFRKRKR